MSPPLRWLWAPGRQKMGRFLDVLSRWLLQGMAPAQAAEGLVELYRGRSEARVARGLLVALQSGLPLSAGLAPWMEANDRHRLAAMERRSDLPAQMQGLADEIQQRTGLIWTLLGRLAYGLLLVAATGAILVLVVHGEVVPILEASDLLTAPSAEFVVLRAVSDHLASWWWLWPLSIGIVAIAVRFAADLWAGRGREICDRLPLLRWYRRWTGAQLLQALALLVQTGDTWMLASQRLAPTAAPWRRTLLERFQDLLAEGRSPVVALERAGWLTTASWLQLKAVAETRDLPDRAALVAREQMRQGEREMTALVRVLQLLLYLVSGAGLFLVLSTGRALGNSGAAGF